MSEWLENGRETAGKGEDSGGGNETEGSAWKHPYLECLAKQFIKGVVVEVRK